MYLENWNHSMNSKYKKLITYILWREKNQTWSNSENFYNGKVGLYIQMGDVGLLEPRDTSVSQKLDCIGIAVASMVYRFEWLTLYNPLIEDVFPGDLTLCQDDQGNTHRATDEGNITVHVYVKV